MNLDTYTGYMLLAVNYARSGHRLTAMSCLRSAMHYADDAEGEARRRHQEAYALQWEARSSWAFACFESVDMPRTAEAVQQ